jgi:hypothetical protein
MRQEHDTSPDESPRNPQRRRITCCLAAIIGAAAGGLFAYLILYWAQAVMPAAYANVLKNSLTAPFLMFTNGASHAVACGIWALVGMMLGLWRYRRRGRNARPWTPLGWTAVVAGAVVIYVICVVTSLLVVGIFDHSYGAGTEDLSRETHVWFPKSTVLLNGYSDSFRGDLVLAKLRVDKRDLGEFLRILKANDAVTYGQWIPDAPCDWWTPNSMRSPVVLEIRRFGPQNEHNQQVIVVMDRDSSDSSKTTDLYLQYSAD